MRCYICQAPTTVGRTRQTSEGVVRVRECAANARHRFETLESRDVPSLKGVGIRRTGDSKLADGAFDWDRFVGDVRASILKSLPDAEILAVCSASVRSIEQRLADISQPLTAKEQEERPELRTWIADQDIATVVESQLRSRHSRLPHVLYALTIRGRADRDGRDGWRSALDFLQWLYRTENYPDLRLPLPTSPERATDRWYPSSRAPAPLRVVKKDGSVRPFRRSQFLMSIQKSMFGRPSARQTSVLVADWVLWGLVGQDEIHTGQLAFGVLDCLRRIDDIAYLRWAALAKAMTTVTQVQNEAQGLALLPSNRLLFDIALQPRRPSGPQMDAVTPPGEAGELPG